MFRKPLPVLLPLLFLIPALTCTVAWADLLDNCESESGPGSYRNLSFPEKDFIAWEIPPDDSYLVQDNNHQEAFAVYECPSAERVTVAIYSRHGSFAALEGDALTRGGDAFPLEYDPSGGEVYCQGQRMVYDAAGSAFLFVEEETVPSHLKEYGLSVAASSDGQTYFRVPRTLLSAQREGPDSYWYEVYEAKLEEGTRFLRLTFTDQTSIQVIGWEERYLFETAGGLSLASVEIIGTEEGPAVPGEEDPPSSDIPGEDAPPADEHPKDGPPEENPPADSSDPLPEDPPNGPSEEDPPKEDPPDNDPPEEDPWEEDFWEDDPREDDPWEEGIPWFEPEENADALPGYHPGEETRDPVWGPEEDPDAGPAFPEEEEEEAPEEEPLPPESSGSLEGSSSSQSSKSSQRSQKEPSSQAESSGEGSDTGEDRLIPVRIPEPEQRSAVSPLWRRITHPDIVPLLLLSLSLLIASLRVLWRRLEEERRRRK